MTTPVSNIQTDKFWFNDFGVLFRPNRVTEFFPSNQQTLEERMNSIARLGLYSSLLTMAYKRDFSKIAIFLATLIITYAVYKNYTKEDVMDVEQPLYKKSMKIVKDIKPTLNNPFMNTLMTDHIENPKKGPALEYYQDTKKAEDIRKDISEKFNHNLYMDINDMYEKNNSQRQFYTTPNTEIPSNQEKFLNFMYPNMTSCKDEAKNCRINEDLRGRPFIFPDQENNPVSGLEL
jgi:hypothetical protein